jgi:hypothetical protein
VSATNGSEPTPKREMLQVAAITESQWFEGWLSVELHVNDGEGGHREVALIMDLQEGVQLLEAMQYLVAEALFGKGPAHMIQHISRQAGNPLNPPEATP